MQMVLSIEITQHNISVKIHGEVCPAKWKEDAETLTPGLDLVGKI